MNKSDAVREAKKVLMKRSFLCPFCGSEDEPMTGQDCQCGEIEYFSECLFCNARGPAESSPSLAINAWRTRKGQ